MDVTDTMEVADHGFLDGRLRILQPVQGYRAATDPVLLAASVPAKAGQSVLDLGCGVGTASICLGHRVPGLSLCGLELQQDYAQLAISNASRNDMKMQIIEGDVLQMPKALKEHSFDHVMTNPPWHDPRDVGSPIQGRDTANRMVGLSLDDWITAAFSRLLPGGWLTIIQRAEWLPDILAAASMRAGDIAVLPLQARGCRDAKRVIVKARKGSRGPFRIAAPLVLHDGSVHVQDGDDFSSSARAILRDGAGLDF